MKGKVIPLNFSEREYPIPYHMHQCITITKGSGWESISLPEIERLKDKLIIGACVIRQSDGTKKKSWVDGNLLLSTEAAVNTYITFKNKVCPTHEKCPMELFLVDYISGPGSYVQLNLTNVNMKESTIHIDTSCLVEDVEDLVIHYIYTDDFNCDYIKPC